MSINPFKHDIVPYKVEIFYQTPEMVEQSKILLATNPNFKQGSELIGRMTFTVQLELPVTQAKILKAFKDCMDAAPIFKNPSVKITDARAYPKPETIIESIEKWKKNGDKNKKG